VIVHEGPLETLLDEHERELRDLLSRLDSEGLSAAHWREDARRIAASTEGLRERLRELGRLEDATERIEELLRLNAIARRNLEAKLRETAARIARSKDGRRHLAPRGGDPDARACDISA